MSELQLQDLDSESSILPRPENVTFSSSLGQVDLEDLKTELNGISQQVKFLRADLEEKLEDIRDRINIMPADLFALEYRDTIDFFRDYIGTIKREIYYIPKLENSTTQFGNDILDETRFSVNELIHELQFHVKEFDKFQQNNVDRSYSYPPRQPIEIGSNTFPRSKLLIILDKSILHCNYVIANIILFLKYLNKEEGDATWEMAVKAAEEAKNKVIEADPIRATKGGKRKKKYASRRRKTRKHKSRRRKSKSISKKKKQKRKTKKSTIKK